MFLISKCRGDRGLGPRTTSVLALGEPKCNGKIRFFLRRHTFFSRILQSRNRSPSASTEVVHRPKLCTGKTPPKWQKCESFRGNGLRSRRQERAMDRMDRPRTSIDERMLSGRRAVMIVWWAVVGVWLLFIDLLLLVAATFCILGLDFCVLAYWGSAALLLSL